MRARAIISEVLQCHFNTIAVAFSGRNKLVRSSWRQDRFPIGKGWSQRTKKKVVKISLNDDVFIYQKMTRMDVGVDCYWMLDCVRAAAVLEDGRLWKRHDWFNSVSLLFSFMNDLDTCPVASTSFWITNLLIVSFMNDLYSCPARSRTILILVWLTSVILWP